LAIAKLKRMRLRPATTYFNIHRLKNLPQWLMVLQLLLLGLVYASPSFAHRTECEKALLALQAKLESSVESDNFLSVMHEEPAAPSVEVIAHRPGEHGGRRLVLQKTGAGWASNYRSAQYDPQGDPRWFIEVIGNEAARFFGFEILNDDQITVPDGPEFTGALKKINNQLRAMGKEPIEISFYLTKPSGQSTRVSEYIERFGREAGLPLAPAGNHLVHDLSFHTGAIFFPAKLVRLKAFTSRYMQGFVEHLKAKYAMDPLRLGGVKYFAYLWRMSETVSIDTATGLVNPGIIARLRDPKDEAAMQMLFAPLVLISNDGQSPISHMVRKIKALQPSRDDYIQDYHAFADVEKLTNALEVLDTATLVNDLTEYNSKPEALDGYRQWSSVYIPQNEKVYESLCRGIGQRRLLIRQAALLLSRAAGPRSL